mmetsp:Transcript_57671/g.117973  ORF Transcript_57671/g.117973 Transcript_57671/m.117973 type:complete len:104 (+) Transcript_57671:69-380(+)
MGWACSEVIWVSDPILFTRLRTTSFFFHFLPSCCKEEPANKERSSSANGVENEDIDTQHTCTDPRSYERRFAFGGECRCISVPHSTFPAARHSLPPRGEWLAI